MIDYTIVIHKDREYDTLMTIAPACPGEMDLAIFLAKRAANQGMKSKDVRGLSRDALISKILTNN